MFLKRVVLLSLFILPLQLFADIAVEPMVLDTISNNKAVVMRQDIKVFNTSKTNNAYVVITAKRIENPGTNAEKEVVLQNPKQLGVFVSPKKVVIPPGGFHTIRVGYINRPGNRDRVFRISVTPKVSLAQDLNADNTSGVKILVAYGVLAIQRPAALKPKIELQRNAKKLLIKNNGNTSVELIDAKQCVADKCTTLKESKRLYAGNSWEINLPTAKPVQFTQVLGNEYKTVESN